MKVKYTRKGLGGVADEEVNKRISKSNAHITIGHIEKVAAFIDVCIDGLLDCLLVDFIQELPQGSSFTAQEATEVMNLILYLVSVTIVHCAGGEQGL